MAEKLYVVQNITVHDPKQTEETFAKAKLLEYEDSSNKFIGANIMRAEVLKVEAENLAEAQKAAQFFAGGSTTTAVVVSEAQWKTS